MVWLCRQKASGKASHTSRMPQERLPKLAKVKGKRLAGVDREHVGKGYIALRINSDGIIWK